MRFTNPTDLRENVIDQFEGHDEKISLCLLLIAKLKRVKYASSITGFHSHDRARQMPELTLACKQAFFVVFRDIEIQSRLYGLAVHMPGPGDTYAVHESPNR